MYGKEKLEALIDADLLAYLGQIEIFGLVPFEAIMCGTPVIVTEESGCGEIVKEQKCGTVVTYGDTAGLERKMVEILNDPLTAKSTVTRGQEYVRANISWETNVSKFEELYKDCLHNT